MSTAGLAAMRERVQLCKMLAKEMPQWRRFYVDTHGNVHFLEALQLSKPQGQPHKQLSKQQGSVSAEQVERPARRV